jgi:hypothetical protein
MMLKGLWNDSSGRFSSFDVARGHTSPDDGGVMDNVKREVIHHARRTRSIATNLILKEQKSIVESLRMMGSFK